MLSDYGLLIDGALVISCLTVSKGDIDLLKPTLNSYFEQTYLYKEMIIISRGTDLQNSQIKDLISQNSDVHLITVPLRLNMSEMLNLGIELSTGDFICRWDEGSVSLNSRLRSQFKTFRGNCVACACKNKDEFVKESLMFKKHCFHDLNNYLYPEQEGLDEFDKLRRSGTIAVVDYPIFAV